MSIKSSDTSSNDTTAGLSLRITVTEQGLFLGEGDGITVGPAGFHDALAGILTHWRTAELGPPPGELPPEEDSVSVLLTLTHDGTIETTLRTRTKAAGGQILSRGHVGTDEQTETWLHQCEGWLARALAGYACEDEPIDLSMEDSDPEYESSMLIAAIQKDPSIASRLWAGPPLDLSELEAK